MLYRISFNVNDDKIVDVIDNNHNSGLDAVKDWLMRNMVSNVISLGFAINERFNVNSTAAKTNYEVYGQIVM